MITKRIKNNWRGSWDSLSTYKPGDIVSTSSSATWTCRQENSGVTPSEGTFWSAGGYMSLQDGTIFRGWGFNAPKDVSINSTQSALDTAFQNLKNRNVNLIRLFLKADSNWMSFDGNFSNNSYTFKRTLPVGFAGINLDRIWYLFDVWAARNPSVADTQLDYLFQAASNAGAEKIRLPVYWNRIETSKGTFDWTNMDKIVSKSADYGISLMPTLMVAPLWARKSSAYFGNIGVVGSDLAAWNDSLAKKQCSSYTPIPTNDSDFASFAAALATRYGTTGNATFWASKNKTINVSSVIGSYSQLSTDDTSSLKIGYAISGSGIPNGTKINQIIDSTTISITTSITSAISSVSATLSPPRITEWQVWNEPDDTASASVTVPANSSTGLSSAVKVDFDIGYNWPNYPSQVWQVNPDGSKVKKNNPYRTTISNNYDWANSLVATTKAVKTAITSVDSNAKMVFASVTSNNPWKKLDLIYGAGGKGLFSSIGYNLYTSDYKPFFEGKEATDTDSYSHITKDLLKSDNQITVFNPSKFSAGDYAIVHSTGEVVKIVSKSGSQLTVARGMSFGKPAQAVSKDTTTLNNYTPGITPYLKYITGNYNVPTIQLTEWGYGSYSLSEANQGSSIADTYADIAKNKDSWNLGSACLFSLVSKNPPKSPSGVTVESNVAYLTTTGTSASGQAKLNVSSVSGISVGMSVFGTGIQSGTKVLTYDGFYMTVTLTNNLTASVGASQKIVFGDSSTINAYGFDWYGILKMQGSLDSENVWRPNGLFTEKPALTSYKGAISSSISSYEGSTESWVKSVNINSDALNKLVNVLDTAAKYDVYVAICGLGIENRIVASNVSMNWYNLVHQNYRWAAQSKYWSAIADKVKDHVAVAYFNLMNEPTADSTKAYEFTNDYIDAFYGGPYTLSMSRAGTISLPSGGSSTRVILYDDVGSFDCRILGYDATFTNSGGFANLTLQTTKLWGSTINVNFISVAHDVDETPEWSNQTTYTSGQAVIRTVGSYVRYFVVKSGQTATATTTSPENQSTKWQEISVVGYEKGGSIYGNWFSQKLTVTPKVNKSSDAIKTEWFSLLKNAILSVAPNAIVTTVGPLETLPFSNESNINVIHAYPNSSNINSLTSAISSLNSNKPTIVEEHSASDSDSYRSYESASLGKNSGSYQDLNIFRATSDSTGFIAQSLEAVDNPYDADDQWSRILGDFQNMSHFMNSQMYTTRMILPNAQNPLRSLSSSKSWKMSSEPFTGGYGEPFIRNSPISIFAANAPKYLNSSAIKQNLSTGNYDSFVLNGTPVLYGIYGDINALSPTFKFDSDCLQFTSSWNQSSSKNAYVGDWINQPLGSAVSGSEYKIDNGSISSTNNVILTYKKPIKNGFSLSVGYTYKQGQSQSGLILGFVDKNNYYKIGIVDSSTGTSITLSNASGTVLATKPVGGRLSDGYSTDTTITCDYKNGVLNASLNFNFFGTIVSTKLDPYSVASLDGYVGVHLAANASPLSNFNLKTKPRLRFYADIAGDTFNLAAIAPTLSSGSSTASGSFGTNPKSIRYRVKDSTGSLATSFSSSDIYPPDSYLTSLSGSSVSTKYLLYARKPSTNGTSSANEYPTMSQGIYNVVSAKNNYEQTLLRGGSEEAGSASINNKDNYSTQTALAGSYPFGSWVGITERDPQDYVYVKNTGHSALTSANTVELEFDLSRNGSSDEANVYTYYGTTKLSAINVWALVSMPRWDSAVNRSIQFGVVDTRQQSSIDIREYISSSGSNPITLPPNANFKLSSAISTSSKQLILQTDTMTGASSSNPYQGMFNFTNGGTWSATSFAINSIVKYTDNKYYISNAATTSSQAPGSANWTLIPDIKEFFYSAARNVLPPSGELRIASTNVEVVSYSNFEVQMPASEWLTPLPSTWFDIANYRFRVFLAKRGVMGTADSTTTGRSHSATTAITICKQWIKLDANFSTPIDRSTVERGSGSASTVAVKFASSATGGLVSATSSGDVSGSSWTNSLKIFRVGGDYRMSTANTIGNPGLFTQLKVANGTSSASYASVSGWQFFDLDVYDRSMLNSMIIDFTSANRPGNVKIAGMFMEYMPSPDPTYRSGKILSF